MFLKFIKDFTLKKIVKESLSKYKPLASQDRIITVGILLDETYFSDKESLKKEIAGYGIKPEAIETLSFIERVKKGQAPDCCHFTYKDVSNSGVFAKEDVAAFIAKPFDLLISYYDVAKPPLEVATLKSKAKFKAGFSTIDNRLNSFMINSQAEHYKEFVAELFKYLKILNKI